jgi:hypothetical protein
MHKHQFVLIEKWSHTSFTDSLKFLLQELEDLLSRTGFGVSKIQPFVNTVLYFT